MFLRTSRLCCQISALQSGRAATRRRACLIASASLLASTSWTSETWLTELMK